VLQPIAAFVYCNRHAAAGARGRRRGRKTSEISARHAPTTIFFYDFSDLLERTSSFAGCVIVSDLNLHLDDDTCSSTTSRFVSLLDSFGLVEQICRPTRGAHQLDVFISRSDGPDLAIRVDPPLVSDHSLSDVVRCQQ